MKIVLFHGTSEENAKLIEKEGFKPDKKYNWEVHSKKGFVYLSLSYAPFYAMSSTKSEKLAIVKVEVDTDKCYPEDDFVMIVNGKPKYTQKELDSVRLQDFKHLTGLSLSYLGNVAVKPKDIKILGIRYFNGKNLLMKCDPCISPINFKIMGEYYEKLSHWIFDGKEIMDFPLFGG